MRVEKDFQEFLELLNKHRVKYCIVGAYAVGFYGYPRYTKDIDILVEAGKENAGKIIQAIREFGIKSADLSEKDFVEKYKVVQLGFEPVRIDLLTSVEGISFENIWKKKEKGLYGTEEVFFIGLNDLIKIKKKAARNKDIIDLERIEKRTKRRWKKS